MALVSRRANRRTLKYRTEENKYSVCHGDVSAVFDGTVTAQVDGVVSRGSAKPMSSLRAATRLRTKGHSLGEDARNVVRLWPLFESIERKGTTPKGRVELAPSVRFKQRG